MRTVTLDKEEFQDVVVANKKKHEKLFHEASSAFYHKLTDILTDIEHKIARKEMNYAEMTDIIYDLDCPRGYCDRYQQILDMVAMETKDYVVLDAADFRRYVKDEWEWTSGFTASYTQATGKAI